ncbi:hypothetical protein [uncultured Planktosalinus sp.]|mgnify:CR=1 FL=1|uniref:toxin-antitoxin system YwqK family antitoxin n=1 Tax=uncultured Planktosalinus sp. TaxID=1810935 RepID=UPI0030DBF3DB
MKNIILTLTLLLIGTHVFAQDAPLKKLIKKGDLIEAQIFHDNGIVSQEGQYNLDGTLQGTWISYDENGNKLAVAKYNNGEKVGTWFFYDGKTLNEVKYTNNKIAQVKTWKEGETQIVSNFE